MQPHRTTTQPDIVLVQRYRLLHLLADDQFAQTWEARDTRLDRDVALRILSPAAREDPAAQAYLRRAGRQQILGLGVEPTEEPRILDGGDDPTYGPFLVAELNPYVEDTRPLTPLQPPSAGLAPAPDPSAAAFEPAWSPPQRRARRTVGRTTQPQRGATGLLALGALIVAGLATLVFLARACAPQEQLPSAPAAATTAAQPARPLSGARAEAPAPEPTAPPTIVAPAAAPTVQPTPKPTIQPTAQPTVEPTIQPTPRPTAQPAVQPVARPTVQPAVQPTLRPTAQPTGPAQAATVGSPVDTIRQHYALIDAKRYADGYALMDANLRSLNSPTDYASWFANKVSIKLVSIDLVSQTAERAVVRTVVSTTDRVNGQAVTTEVAEQFVLRNEEGAWRIDQVSRL